MARIAIAGFLHEVNSFSDHVADYDYFCNNPERPLFLRGDSLITKHTGSGFCPAGFIDKSRPEDQLIPLVWANGGAGGTVTRDAFERISAEILGGLSLALPVDGVYLDLHGAMVSEDFEDAEGELLRRVRAIVGKHIPVVTTLDYHANISDDMLKYADAMVIYRTYPHVDRPNTGARAALVMQKLLSEGIPAGRAIRHASFLLPIDFQCTLVEPSQSLANWEPSSSEGMYCASYAAGFPPSDTYWCGPSVIAYAATQELADQTANDYFDFFTSQIPNFNGKIWGTQEGVSYAIEKSKLAQKPIVVADTCDNPGAGGSSDTTGIIHELLAQNAQDVLVGYLCDPEVAQKAFQAGAGAKIMANLGAKNSPPGVKPVVGEFEVVSVSNQKFTMTGPMVRGMEVDFGPMALLRIGGVKIAVLSYRFQAYDQAPFFQLGIDPATCKILILKSSCHFRADFQDMASEVISISAPGFYDPDPMSYAYKELRDNVSLNLI